MSSWSAPGDKIFRLNLLDGREESSQCLNVSATFRMLPPLPRIWLLVLVVLLAQIAQVPSTFAASETLGSASAEWKDHADSPIDVSGENESDAFDEEPETALTDAQHVDWRALCAAAWLNPGEGVPPGSGRIDRLERPPRS